MACKQPRSSTSAWNQGSELSSTSQDTLFTHFHPVPCDISEIIDTQEALEGSANEEDDGASRRDDGASSEDDGASRRDDSASSEDDGASRREDGASSDDDSDYVPAMTDDSDAAEQEFIPLQKKRKFD